MTTRFFLHEPLKMLLDSISRTVFSEVRINGGVFLSRDSHTAIEKLMQELTYPQEVTVNWDSGEIGKLYTLSGRNQDDLTEAIDVTFEFRGDRKLLDKQPEGYVFPYRNFVAHPSYINGSQRLSLSVRGKHIDNELLNSKVACFKDAFNLALEAQARDISQWRDDLKNELLVSIESDKARKLELSERQNNFYLK